MMITCLDQITPVIIPLIILNLTGTTLIVLILQCIGRYFYNKGKKVDDNTLVVKIKPKIIQNPIIYGIQKNNKATTDNNDDNFPYSMNNKSADKPEIQGNNKFVTDDELIAHVREVSNYNFTPTKNSPSFNWESGEIPDWNFAKKKDNKIIESQDSPENISKKIIDKKHLTENSKPSCSTNIPSESNDEASLGNTADALISMTQKIAGTLDNAKHIPQNKKHELSNLLKEVPNFISKIIDMNDDELNDILEQTTIPGKSHIENKNDYIRRESEYLVRILESLHI